MFYLPLQTVDDNFSIILQALLVSEIGRYEDGIFGGLLCLRTGITMVCSHGCGTTPVAHRLLNKNNRIRKEWFDKCLSIP